MRRTHLVSATAIAILMLALAAPTVAAHKTTYSDDGKIKIVWGFLNEPAITMTKTGLDLILTDNTTGAPLEGVEKTLNASLVYGDQVHAFENFRAQHGQKGRYTDVITLTRPGIYMLRLEGTINGTAISMTTPGAHEIQGIEETYFPALAATQQDAKIKELETKIATLEAKVASLDLTATTQSRTPTTLNPQNEPANDVPAPGAASLLALLAVVALISLRRKA